MKDWPHCDRCGRFINFKPGQFDMSTPYGSACDLEPPDDEFLCRRCMIREAIEDAERILAGRRPHEDWRPGYASRLAWSIARGVRKHGLTLEGAR